ncbi:hypothetical protein F511_01645 [Dorcoceras hygrometricum]|nr:hypothetical protein F511_01645 [Dorcoceras hygrometricum]
MEPLNQAHEARQETVHVHKKDDSDDRRTSDIKTQGSEYRRTPEQPQVHHKKHGTDGWIAINSMGTNTLEASVMDLEELVNKVKWIKKILEQGIYFSDGVRPEWEFVDQSPASSTSK